MQGYLLTEGTDATGVAACLDCARNGNRSIDGRETVWLGEDFIGRIPCTTCDVEIDGVEEEPKPQSFTVTVEVLVLADADVVTAADAGEYVVDILAGYFDCSEHTDVKEHF